VDKRTFGLTGVKSGGTLKLALSVFSNAGKHIQASTVKQGWPCHPDSRLIV
jgi:hypothetical protein